MSKYNDVIAFWFDEIDSKFWWKKEDDFDRLIQSRFGEVLESAEKCELYRWRENEVGRLAEIIVLDQFSRNIYRDTPMAFTNDSLALGLAQECVALGLDKKLTGSKRSFLYMPYMHSESKVIHEEAVSLFEENGVQSNLDFELKHKVIIDRFGRYPHRNRILSRESTPEELEFLSRPGSSF